MTDTHVDLILSDAGPVNIAARLAGLKEHWKPCRIADFNDCGISVAKFQGPFPWHAHGATDELFLVMDGELVMEFRDRTERLTPGEMIVVPRGVEHRTNCPEECAVLMLARKDQEEKP